MLLDANLPAPPNLVILFTLEAPKVGTRLIVVDGLPDINQAHLYLSPTPYNFTPSVQPHLDNDHGHLFAGNWSPRF